MSCKKCAAKINRNLKLTYVNCASCQCIYHCRCVALSDTDVEYHKQEKISWVCSDCEFLKRSTRNDDSPLPKQLHKNHLDKTDNVDMMDKIYGTLQNTIATMNNRFDKLDESTKVIASLVQENSALKSKLNYIELKLEKLEQLLLINSVDIINLPVKPNENVCSSVLELIENGLKIPIKVDDIDSCYRVRNTNTEKVGKVIITFNNKNIKQKIMDKQRQMKKIPSSLVDSNSKNLIFINDRLTPYRRNLLFAAKKCKLEKSYKYLWMRNYKIMMRKTDGGVIQHINSLDDLDKL